MYVSQKIRRAIVLSVMTGSLTLLPSFCPINVNVSMPVSVVSMAHAEVRTYTGIGKYIMSEYETQEIAQQRAINKAMRDAKDKAGVHLQTYSRSVSGNLTNDEIFAITNNITDVLEKKCVPVPFEANGEAGLMYEATVTVTIDPNGISEWLKRDAQDRFNIVNQNNAERQADEENDRKVEDLRKRLRNATTDEERARIRAEYEQADNEFRVNQFLKEGNQLYYQGDYNGAIAKYNEALNLNPNFDWAYNNRGLAYGNLQNYDAAMADYNKAIELNPNDAEAYNNRGNTYVSLKQYDQALADYTRAIELNPDSVESYNNRGFVYLCLKKHNEAIADCTKAIELNPNLDKAYYRRGLSYRSLDKYDEAISDFNKAIELKPNDSDYFMNRGSCYLMSQNADKALADFNKTIALEPNKTEVFLHRGIAYAVLSKYKEAIADLTKYINSNPNDANGYSFRAMCYEATGDTIRAQVDKDKAKQLGNNA
ncbi:MAG: tetratricopeptide repeat protein [Selenomonadaceae bacterium]|nr:tetratricopeptide repeat protein [Selenomonadaceae bacterium]MBR1859125.1 tetratricopeptide repeat protein [Selenomonadaceae bacterium]